MKGKDPIECIIIEKSSIAGKWKINRSIIQVISNWNLISMHTCYN